MNNFKNFAKRRAQSCTHTHTHTHTHRYTRNWWPQEKRQIKWMQKRHTSEYHHMTSMELLCNKKSKAMQTHTRTGIWPQEINTQNECKRRTSECNDIKSDGIILRIEGRSHAHVHIHRHKQSHLDVASGKETHKRMQTHKIRWIIMQKKGTAMHTHTRTGMWPKYEWHTSECTQIRSQEKWCKRRTHSHAHTQTLALWCGPRNRDT